MTVEYLRTLLLKDQDHVAIVALGPSIKRFRGKALTLPVWTGGFLCKQLLNYRRTTETIQRIVPRVTAYFEVHKPEMWSYGLPPGGEKLWVEYMKQSTVPIVMHRRFRGIPACVPFPMQMFDIAPAGTLDYMVAMGIYLGVKRISMYGCDYTAPHELYFQRHGIAYWIGRARGAGIQVDIHGELLRPILKGRYGPDYPTWPPDYHPKAWKDLELYLPRQDYRPKRGAMQRLNTRIAIGDIADE